MGFGKCEAVFSINFIASSSRISNPELSITLIFSTLPSVLSVKATRTSPCILRRRALVGYLRFWSKSDRISPKWASKNSFSTFGAGGATTFGVSFWGATGTLTAGACTATAATGSEEGTGVATEECITGVVGTGIFLTILWISGTVCVTTGIDCGSTGAMALCTTGGVKNEATCILIGSGKGLEVSVDIHSKKGPTANKCREKEVISARVFSPVLPSVISYPLKSSVIIAIHPIFRLSDYNVFMNFDLFSGKTVLLLGKTRSLEMAEFQTLLALHTITITQNIEVSTAVAIEGRMVNPLEQNVLDEIYTQKKIPIVSIEAIEEWLCSSIEPNRLLMSLKLSRNMQRLVAFIKNPYITDEFFFKLLSLYDWHNEGIFDNDSNRDVTAALIGRFYVDLQRNHSVQYAMSGLAHLVEQYGTGELITAISQLQPIKKEIQHPNDISLNGVLDAIALHSDTPDTLLKELLNTRSHLIACREPLSLEDELLTLNNETISQILAQNITLSQSGAQHLEQSHPETIASFYPLDQVRFERLRHNYATSLASNISLTPSMQTTLMEMNDVSVFCMLACNKALLMQHLETLFALQCYTVQLASNTSLCPQQLETLYQSSNTEILKALASNTSTPVEILYQLSLDQRYERNVKTNAAFGHHIQTANIGWS